MGRFRCFGKCSFRREHRFIFVLEASYIHDKCAFPSSFIRSTGGSLLLPGKVVIPPSTFIRLPASCCASWPFPRSQGIPTYSHSQTVRTVHVSFHYPLFLASFNLSLSLSLASTYSMLSLYLTTYNNHLSLKQLVVGASSLAGRSGVECGPILCALDFP